MMSCKTAWQKSLFKKEQQIEQEFNEAQKAAQLAASQAPQKKSGAPASQTRRRYLR